MTIIDADVAESIISPVTDKGGSNLTPLDTMLPVAYRKDLDLLYTKLKATKLND